MEDKELEKRIREVIEEVEKELRGKK